jgi:hypothetical protein
LNRANPPSVKRRGITDLDEELGSAAGGDTAQLLEIRSRLGDQGSELTQDATLLGIQHRDLFGVAGEQRQPHRVHRIDLDGGYEPAGGFEAGTDLLRCRQPIPQMLGELVQQRLGFPQQLLADLGHAAASTVPQADHLPHRVRSATFGELEGTRQPGLSQRLAGDPFGIQTVGLAAATLAGTLRGAGRAHIPNVVVAVGEEHRRVPTQATGALNPDPGHRPERRHPGLKSPVPDPGHLEMLHPKHRPGRAQHTRRQGPFVGIDPHHVPTD